MAQSKMSALHCEESLVSDLSTSKSESCGSVSSIDFRNDETARTPLSAILQLSCFFGVLLAAALGLNALIAAGVRHVSTSSLGAWNAAMQGRVNADILVSGSSRAAYHYDPRLIEEATGRSAFNFGRVGTQTDLQVAVLKAYLRHNRKPQLVVQNLDAFTFVTSRELLDPAMYVPYLDDSVLYESLKKFDPEVMKSRYVPLYGYVVPDMNLTWLTGLKALVGIDPKEDYFLGFSPRSRTWNDDFSSYKASNPHGVAFAIEPAGVQALEELIELCQENGIQLVLVYSPEYEGMQKMTNNRLQIFARFRELSARYHVPFWDYSHWEFTDDTHYFYNSQHLNAAGAELFSSDIAHRLTEYLKTKGQASTHSGSDSNGH